MKFKKIIMLITMPGLAIAPLASMVSCGGAKSDTKDNENEVNKLTKQLEDLQKQLEDVKRVNANSASQSAKNSDLGYQQKIDDLTSKITSLQEKIKTNSSKELEVKKEKTIEEKTIDFQTFQLLHSSEFSILSFEEIKKTFDPNLPMARGIESFSLSQTASYLQNLAIKLGFQENQVELNDLSQTPSGDSITDADRAEVFAHTKKIIDGLKVMSDTARDAVLDRDTYTRFATLYSIGNPLTTQIFDQSGIDTSSFGQLNPKSIDNSSKSYLYPNFSLTTKSGYDVQLFSGFPYLEDGDDEYGDPTIFGTQRIDADRPGSVITTLDFAPTFKLIKDADKSFTQVQLLQNFSKKFEVSGLANIFPKSVVADRQHNLNILEAIIRKMSVVFSPENKEAIISLRKNADKNDVSQRLIDALEFLGSKFESVNNGFTLKDVSKVYDEMNNGSHYFKSVELFARGLSGLVFSKPPKGGDLYAGYTEDPKSSYAGIIGMAFDHLEGTLLPWGTLQGNGLYTLASEKFSWQLDFRDYKAPNDQSTN